MTAWREKWLSWRNNLLSDPKFQSWAGRFPLTRIMARRRARGLFDIVAGFVYSQVAYAIVSLDILPMLAQKSASVDDIALATGLDVASARRLLLAAQSLDLVDCVGSDQFVPGIHGAALLGNPGVVAMIRHHALLYADMSDPVALLRRGGGGGVLAAFWPYADGHGDVANQPVFDAYSDLMAASQPMVAQQVLAAYPLGKHRRLLDVGGGEGAFVSHVAAAHEGLELGLFDMPPVAARARRKLAELGLVERVTVAEGSFLDGGLPQGADVMTLVRILHDHDDAAAQQILRHVAIALPADGTLLIVEPMADIAGARPVGHAYFGMYLLAMGSGRPRTAREIGGMLRIAGFGTWRAVPTSLPLAASLIVARK